MEAAMIQKIDRWTKKYVLLILLFLSVVPGTFAQSDTLKISNIHSAINYVLNENPDLETYKLNQTKAEQELKNQKLSILPNISGGIGGNYYIDLQSSALPGEIVGLPGEKVIVEFGTKYIYNAGISANMDLLDMSYFFKIKISEIIQDIQNAQTEAFKQKIIEQTALYYSAIQITTQSIANNQKNLNVADSILSITEQRYKEGIIDLAAVNLSKISANNIRQTIISNEMVLHQYYTELKILMGLQLEDMLQITEELKLTNVSFIELKELNPDKNLEIYNLQLQQSEIDIKTKRASFYPKLSTSGYFGYQQFKDDFVVAFDDNAWKPYNYIGLNLSIPIFNSYANKGNLKIAKVNQQINEQVLETENMKSKMKDNQLLTDYENSLEQLKLSKQNHELFKQNADFSYNKYKEGIIGIDSYYKSFEDYLKAENSYLNSLSLVYTYYSKILSRQQ
jgi:outer membrane protein TolC